MSRPPREGRYNAGVPPIAVDPIAGPLGAEISGVDLSADLDETTIEAIRRAWLEHLVIFFRDQPLPPARFLAFARRFGEPVEYPFVNGLDEAPRDHPRGEAGARARQLRRRLALRHHLPGRAADGEHALAREVPAVGGDTLFANMYLAYETLSPGMQRLLDGLRASTARPRPTRRRRARTACATARGRTGTGVRGDHPVVRMHPETGRKALYVNVAHTVGFEDMTAAESAPILDYLFRHQVQPEFTCRFRWQAGSIAFWDNRCAQHNAVNDYHGHGASCTASRWPGAAPATRPPP